MSAVRGDPWRQEKEEESGWQETQKANTYSFSGFGFAQGNLFLSSLETTALESFLLLTLLSSGFG